MSKLKNLFFFVASTLLLASCGKDPMESKLTVSADTLVFKGNQSLILTVTTDCAEARHFVVNRPYEWINVYPSEGAIVAGEPVEITVTSYLDDPMNIIEDDLYVSTIYDSKKVKLVGLPEDYTDYILSETLFFPENVNDAIMRISNYGNTTLEYSIAASSSFISFSPTSGQLAMMQSTNINVSIDREHLLTVTHPALYVTIDGTTDTVPLVLEKKYMLPNDVVDAEYAKATNLLVYVSTDSKLNIYHPDTRVLSSVALSFAPTCVSISLDGTKAVVGHDAHVTYVDLLTESVLTENTISCEASDIVLANNGWTYVFPSYGMRILCLDMNQQNALINEHTGYSIYYNTKAKIHPSGKYIYGADNGLSPSDIEKYDIQNGTAHYLYDSPYHGDYGMGGDLWFEESGERLFTRAGTVFKTSETQSSDMIYNGKITLEGSYRSILWLDQLDLKHELYLVLRSSSWYNDDPNPPYVYVYNSNNLVYKTKLKVEDYSVATDDGNVIYSAIPYFVFAHSNGNELYVITKADGSGMVREWAIQTIDLR